MAVYTVEILDTSRDFKAVVRNLVPLDNEGNFLKYGKKLSDWGTCRFRIGTKDPIFDSEGDIVQPYQNHVRIKRHGVIVWQGVIVDNPRRNKLFIEVEARTYLYLLSRTLIRHDTASASDANYRTFKTGTMASNISTILTQAKADMGLPLTDMTTGAIENPNYPSGYIDDAGTALTGAWSFTKNFQLKFSYNDVLYVLNAFGMYSNSDFELTDDLVFNFKKFIGNKQPNMKFFYGINGQIEDYEVPRDGDHMATYLVGLAADNQNNILKVDKLSTNVNTYGKIMAVAPYSDVKNKNLLSTRVLEELRMVDHPDEEINIVLNDRAYPLGQYGLGDTVTIEIIDNIIEVRQLRRIVQIDVAVHNTGKETIRLGTNKPRDDQ